VVIEASLARKVLGALLRRQRPRCPVL